jgi:hypothetical protein
MAIRESKWTESENVQKLRRGRAFLHLDYFFDFLQPGKMFKDKDENLRQTQRFLRYLVSNFKIKNAKNMIGFLEFAVAEQIRYPIYEWLFELLLIQYKK